MALVGRRDGRNFGYSRRLSYAGPQARWPLWRRQGALSSVAGLREVVPFRKGGPASMIRGRLIGKYWPTMRSICVTWLGAVISPSAPHKSRLSSVTEPWLRFAVISV